MDEEIDIVGELNFKEKMTHAITGLFEKTKNKNYNDPDFSFNKKNNIFSRKEFGNLNRIYR